MDALRAFDPARVHAVVVGVEHFPRVRSWDLAGASGDALRFARWLRGQGVPPENIALLLAPLPERLPQLRASAEGAGLAIQQVGSRDQIMDVLAPRTVAWAGDLLYIYWGGHGVLTHGDRRVLLCPDASLMDKRAIELNDLREYLTRPDVVRFTRQIFLVDTCAEFFEDLHEQSGLAIAAFPPGRRSTVEQFVLHAAAAGQVAGQDPIRHSGLFSEAVLNWLEQHSSASEPDLTALETHIRKYFADLARAGAPRQTPVSLHIRSLGGSADTIVVQAPGQAAVAPAGRPRVTGLEVSRPELLDPLMTHLLTPHPEAGAVVVLRGAGGFGKTTLAALACDHARVRDRFGDRVFWITLGEHADLAELLAKINDLLAALTGTSGSFSDLEQASQHLGRLLSAEPALLVIDDVWHAEQLVPLFAGHCTRLVTTRIGDLPTPNAATVSVDAMPHNQALDMLRCQIAADGPIPDSDWTRLLRLTGGWPLLLQLANSALRRRTSYGKPLADAIRLVEAELAASGPTAFDPASPAHRQQAVTTTVDASVRLLADADPSWPKRFVELAVFPRGVPVPLATLGRYWGDVMTAAQVEDLCVDLADLSLVRRLMLDDLPSLVLHDVITDHLIRRAADQLPALHRRLLQAHVPVPAPGPGQAISWWELPYDEPYLWNHLAHHLRHTADDAVDELFCDFRWIERRMGRDGPTALKSDFAHATSDRAILLREALNRSSHLLFPPLDPPSAFAATLASRLHGIEGLTDLVERNEQHREGHWLSPVWPLPDQRHPAFLGTLAASKPDVTSFAIAPDSTWFATGHADGTVRTWNIDDGRLLARVRPHEGAIHSLAVTGDGRTIASLRSGKVVLWDPEESDDLRVCLGYRASPVSRVVADPVRCRVALCGSLGGVHFFNHEGVPQHLRKPWTRLIAHVLHPTLMAWLPIVLIMLGLPPMVWVGAPMLAEISLWFVRAWLHDKHPRNLGDYHRRYVHSVTFSPDGSLLATAAEDGTVRLWDAVSGQLAATFATHAKALVSVAIDPSNRMLAVSSEGIELWDVHKGEQLLVERFPTPPLPSVQFSPDGELLACTGDESVRVWRVPDGTPQSSLSGLTFWPQLAFAGDSGLIFTSGNGTAVSKWDLSRLITDPAHQPQVERVVRATAFAPHGEWVATAGPGSTVTVRAIDGTLLADMTEHTDSVHAVAVSPDGSWLASGGGDNTVRIWKPDGTLLTTMTGHTDTVLAVAVSPDGSWLASGGLDNIIRIWRPDGTLLHTIPAGDTGGESDLRGVHQLTITPDGGLLVAAGTDGLIRSWKPGDWSPEVLFDVRSKEWYKAKSPGRDAVAVSKDGRRLAAVSRDARIKLWNSAQAFLMDTSPVAALSFSPDGKFLADARYSGVLRIWHVYETHCVAALRVDGALFHCAWSPTDDVIAASGTAGGYLFVLRSKHTESGERQVTLRAVP